MRGIIVGTGPSLRSIIGDLWRFPGLIFCPNNTPADLLEHGVKESQIVWLACDPDWHAHYGAMSGAFDKWHWDEGICEKYGYQYIPGVWHKGLWLKDKSRISYNHCSTAQLLNLAVTVYECDPILLVGHDFSYPESGPRHYFENLSETPGLYPKPIRKESEFDKGPGEYDLIDVYREISASLECGPRVVNCTDGSKLPWFEFGNLEDWLT